MDSKNRVVFGIFPSDVQAERAVDLLSSAGFPSSSISVLFRDTRSTREFAHEKHTKAPEGTTTGATVGGVIGGTLGVLAGIGALAIPGIGPLIAGGPIIAGLAGLGAGGAVGGIVGALVGMGIPEYEAKRYEGRVKDGGTLFSVHCDTAEQVDRAKHLLAGAGATDISSTSESTGVHAGHDKDKHESDTLHHTGAEIGGRDAVRVDDDMLDEDLNASDAALNPPPSNSRRRANPPPTARR